MASISLDGPFFLKYIDILLPLGPKYRPLSKASVFTPKKASEYITERLFCAVGCMINDGKSKSESVETKEKAKAAAEADVFKDIWNVVAA